MLFTKQWTPPPKTYTNWETAPMVFLAKRDWKGPRLFLLRYLIAMVYNGVVLLLALSFALPVASLVGTILGEAIVFCAGYRYYQKRRPLFSPAPHGAAVPAGAPPEGASRTCPRCGAALPWDGRFCPRCGEPTPPSPLP